MDGLPKKTYIVEATIKSLGEYLTEEKEKQYQKGFGLWRCRCPPMMSGCRYYTVPRSNVAQSMPLNHHIHTITNKTTRTLNFIKCTLSKCTKDVKAIAT